MQKFQLVFKKVFGDAIYAVIVVSAAFNLLFIYYLIFFQSTTLEVFLKSNTALYGVLSIGSAVLISVLFGIAVSFLLYHLELRQISQAGSGRGIFGTAVGALANGCPVCGAWLLSLLGIGGGLAVFPLQGLELRGLSLLFLGWSVYSSTAAIYNHEKGIVCSPQNSWQKHLPFAAGAFAVLLILSLPIIAVKYDFKLSFQPDKKEFLASVSGADGSLAESLWPEKGHTINAVYGNVGPEMLKAGVIDLEKFKQVYEQAGQPLTDDQLKILIDGSDEKITISKDNAYFLLNFFWAFGLANKNPILNEGPLMKYGGLAGAGNFASTGGWTLAKSKPMNYFSKYEILHLSAGQQAELEDMANNSYRPCCNNSTAFSDCNHGMALLGLGEVMAYQGADAEEMFNAGKYFNSFWFPQQYYDLAIYFKASEHKDWSKVDAKTVMGKDYSSASGWSRVRSWLKTNGLLEQAPSGGGGCGV